MINCRQKPQNKHLCIMTLSEHTSVVAASTFSPDGEVFVTGSWDNTAIVWEVKAGKRLLTLEHPSAVKILAISPDGQHLLANFHLWELKTGKLVHQFEGDEQSATIGLFSKDSTQVLTGELRGLPKLWNLHSKQLIHALPHCDDDLESVDSADISSNGAYIATGSFDFRVWNSKSGAKLIHYNEEFGCHSSVISPDNKYALAGLSSGIILKFDIETGKVTQSFADHGSNVVTSKVGCCAVTKDSNRIVASGNNEVKVWNANNGKCLASWQAHEFKVTKCLIAPNDQFFVTTGDNDTTAKVWDFNGNLLRSLGGHLMTIRSCSISPDSSVLVTTSADGAVRLWDLVSPHTLPNPPPHSGEVIYCGISNSGKYIISASEASMNVWNADAHEIIHSLPHPNKISTCLLLQNHVISQDPERVARVWEISTGSLVHTLPIIVHRLALSADSKTLLAVTKQGLIQNIEPETWRVRWQINSGNAEIRAVSISSSNNNFAYSMTHNFAIIVRSLNDGQPIHSYDGHTGVVDKTAFSHDDKLLVSGARDGTTLIWDLNGGEKRELFKTVGWVYALIFSPDGKLLLTTGEDQQFRVWDCQQWSLLWSTKIGLFNKSKWVTEESIMLQTTDAIVIYNLSLRKITGSWFFSVIGDADLISTPSNNQNNTNNNTVMVAGTSTGEVYSFDIEH